MFFAHIDPRGKVMMLSQDSQAAPSGWTPIAITPEQFRIMRDSILGAGVGFWYDGAAFRQQEMLDLAQLPESIRTPGMVDINWSVPVRFKFNGEEDESSDGVVLRFPSPGRYTFEITDPKYINRRYEIKGE